MSNAQLLHSMIFELTDKIGFNLSITEGRKPHEAAAALQGANRELHTLKRLNVANKRLMVIAIELLEGAIASTQYPNTMRAQFTLGQKIAWAIAENSSYLEVGAWLFEELYALVKRDRAGMSEPEHAKRNALVTACHAWMLQAHRHLELHELEKKPHFHDVYMFLQGLA